MGLLMQREQFSSSLLWDMLGIADEYAAEISVYDEDLNPDYEKYYVLERANVLRCFTLREHGELKGFASCYLEMQIHHKRHYRAVIETIFVEKDARIGMAGAKFLSQIEAKLKAEGVKSISIASGLKHNISNLLQRMGYIPHEIIHTKVI